MWRVSIGLTAALLAAIAAGADGQTVCRPADAISAAYIREMARYASAESGDDRTIRDSLKIPLTARSEVTLVTAESVCKKAYASFQANLNGQGATPFSGSGYVIKFGGNGFAVLDPRFHAGDTTNRVVHI